MFCLAEFCSSIKNKPCKIYCNCTISSVWHFHWASLLVSSGADTISFIAFIIYDIIYTLFCLQKALCLVFNYDQLNHTCNRRISGWHDFSLARLYFRVGVFYFNKRPSLVGISRNSGYCQLLSVCRLYAPFNPGTGDRTNGSPNKFTP